MFGEVLWDIINGEEHLGGAPFNLAAHAVQCGLRAAMVSRLGDDRLGHAARHHMQRYGVDDRWTTLDTHHPTGTVAVTLKDGQPSYVIQNDSAWDYIALDEEQLRELLCANPRAFCFGTLAQRSITARRCLAQLVTALADSLIFYDANLRQEFWTPARVAVDLTRADIVKVNGDEAQLLGKLLYDGACTPSQFGAALLAHNPRIKVVLVTLGGDGCVVCERQREVVACPVQAAQVVDTVGAGDAFSAAFLAAWLQGADAVTAAKAGNARGAWVAARRGAIPASD